GSGAAAEFERLYRANIAAITAYFARRSADPHVVADLTADTFVTAITSFGSFDPKRGNAGLGVRDRPARVRRLLRRLRPAPGPAGPAGGPARAGTGSGR